MKVLSLNEPYATLIKDGVKTVETRRWKTNYRGPIYIHASLSKSKLSGVDIAEKLLKSEEKPGFILCKCELVDCIEMTDEYLQHLDKESDNYKCGIYAEGGYAWQLKLLEVLEAPILCKGKLGLWNYDDETKK